MPSEEHTETREERTDMSSSVRFQQILGIRFLVGTAHDAIDRISADGGMVVMYCFAACGLARTGRHASAKPQAAIRSGRCFSSESRNTSGPCL